MSYPTFDSVYSAQVNQPQQPAQTQGPQWAPNPIPQSNPWSGMQQQASQDQVNSYGQQMNGWAAQMQPQGQQQPGGKSGKA